MNKNVARFGAPGIGGMISVVGLYVIQAVGWPVPPPDVAVAASTLVVMAGQALIRRFGPA